MWKNELGGPHNIFWEIAKKAFLAEVAKHAKKCLHFWIVWIFSEKKKKNDRQMSWKKCTKNLANFFGYLAVNALVKSQAKKVNNFKLKRREIFYD